MPPALARLRGHPFWIAPAFFLLAAAPGCWIPVLANVLKAYGWGHLITITFLIPPLASTLSPLLFAAAADQRFAAEKVLAFSVWVGSIFLFGAFHVLESGGHPALFLAGISMAALTGSPAWSILSAVALTNLRNQERDFGLFRVWGTLGWMVAGWTVSALSADDSALAGKIAVAARILAGFVCLMLPHTPPQRGGTRTWKDALGLSAFGILKHRDIAVFLLTSLLFSIPLAAFYMQTPQMLSALQCQSVAATLTIGQATEIVALLVLGYALTRWRIKWLLLLALVSGTLRYAWYAVGAAQGSLSWVIFGIALHGICWTFFFEAGRVLLNQRVEAGMRAQVQALMSLVTGGIGSIVGTLIVGTLHQNWVIEDSLPQWQKFWSFLSFLCGACVLFFVLGYQGRKNLSR